MGIAVDLDPQWPLARWRARVLDLPILQFSDGDLCIACRQEVHLVYVIPVAISRLHSDPLAGDNYEGELLVAIASIPAPRWEEMPAEKEHLCRYIVSLKRDFDDEDVNAAIRTLRKLCDAG